MEGERAKSYGNKVFLNVYDLGPCITRANDLFADVLGLGGAFHVAVEVYGKEWYYSVKGIVVNEKITRHHDIHVYRQSVDMGETSMTDEEVDRHVRHEMIQHWKGAAYNDFCHNCYGFSDELLWKLVGKHHPPLIARFAKLIEPLAIGGCGSKQALPNVDILSCCGCAKKPEKVEEMHIKTSAPCPLSSFPAAEESMADPKRSRGELMLQDPHAAQAV
eukprot:gnl/TRDRNA2_/TRDRNA2_198940_c0_seq1.p1 gnl/TRDRNA2_/TRDRNA2_198940_c0~~gnl/TRDRNA2_/TRDRNA2_198940_c0_seq1.p1  ORF type:complete len:218 (-),score=23.97 gnl/TRDRNA2_/TRDRNA2_198940_c0_seq1:125-778(-)